MEITSNKIDGANAQIKAVITTQEVNEKVEKIAKSLSKTVSIQGFRKGKVPVSIIKKQYGDKLVQDAESELLRDVLAKGQEELEISNDSLIGEPNITQFDKSDDKIEVTIELALRPKIEMENYADLVEEFEAPTVTDEEVEARIKELAQAQAPLKDVEEERPLAKDDTAVFDFEGSVDGKLFEGGSAQNFSLVIGSGRFIPGFEDQMVGMNKGEEKVLKVTFPEDYQGDLAGKDAEFKVKLHKIQTQGEVVIDDELAKQMLPGDENANVEELKKQVKEQIKNEKVRKLYNDELKPALLEKFVETFQFDLPKFVVEQEIDIIVNRKASQMSEDEIKELRENSDKLKELRESVREEAEKSVKATFIIDTLAQLENVKVDENEIMQTIYFEALQTGQDPQKVYEQYKEAGYLPAIQMSMVEDKVLSKLLDAKMKEV
ncbi:Cell division trigger factor [hydrothermal vent metagenome]|uniref:peptidylprolyl isomerase n=1 Tax=hydrothermal vent metagenome TaxID=652676 RepID=A0A1W1D695_9ZZZZ